jgi:hypothetical protein
MDEGIGITTRFREIQLRGLEPGEWRVDLIDPQTGDCAQSHTAMVDSAGCWTLPPGNFASCLPTFEDWLLIARR